MIHEEHKVETIRKDNKQSSFTNTGFGFLQFLSNLLLVLAIRFSHWKGVPNGSTRKFRISFVRLINVMKTFLAELIFVLKVSLRDGNKK